MDFGHLEKYDDMESVWISVKKKVGIYIISLSH